MPKAAAAPEARSLGEPFIPEPLADTAKSLGLVEQTGHIQARTVPPPASTIVPVGAGPEVQKAS